MATPERRVRASTPAPCPRRHPSAVSTPAPQRRVRAATPAPCPRRPPPSLTAPWPRLSAVSAPPPKRRVRAATRAPCPRRHPDAVSTPPPERRVHAATSPSPAVHRAWSTSAPCPTAGRAQRQPPCPRDLVNLRVVSAVCQGVRRRRGRCPRHVRPNGGRLSAVSAARVSAMCCRCPAAPPHRHLPYQGIGILAGVRVDAATNDVNPGLSDRWQMGKCSLGLTKRDW